MPTPTIFMHITSAIKVNRDHNAIGISMIFNAEKTERIVVIFVA